MEGGSCRLGGWGTERNTAHVLENPGPLLPPDQDGRVLLSLAQKPMFRLAERREMPLSLLRLSVCLPRALLQQPEYTNLNLLGGHVDDVRRPVAVVMHRVALLFVDGVAFRLGEAEEPSDHGEVLPQGPVFWRRVFFPA